MMPTLETKAENEHFEMSDSVISWMESYNSSTYISEEAEIDSDFISSAEFLRNTLPSPASHHQLSATGMAWNMVKIFSQNQISVKEMLGTVFTELNTDEDEEKCSSPKLIGAELLNTTEVSYSQSSTNEAQETDKINSVRMRGNDEWAPPRAQIIFNIHEGSNFRKIMMRQNYLCAGCGAKIDVELARRLVLYCHYLGKYFCKCCFSHKSIHLPGYILQKWDFHKYPVSHFALQLLDRIANEPLFNINDINPSLYRKVKKLRHLIDIRLQLFYLKIYITTCANTDKLSNEFISFTHQHLLQNDVHLYSLNNMIEIQHGKLYEYLNDLVTRSISHIAQCDRCRAKGHYCQLCGPSSLISSMILNSNVNGSAGGQIIDNTKNSQPKLKHSNSIGQNISSAENQNLKTTETNSQRHSRSSSGNYSSITLSNSGLTVNSPAISPGNSEHEPIFPFEVGRVAQCSACGCCFHLKCFLDAEQNCPKCERIQRRKIEISPTVKVDTSNVPITSEKLMTQ